MRQAWKELTKAQQDMLQSIGEAFKRDNERADTLARLSKVGQALVSLEALPGELERLLQQVAENAQEVLDADVVTVYQYIQNRGEFLVPPVQVGEVHYPDVRKDKVFDDDVVFTVVRGGIPLWSPDAQGTPQLSGPFEVDHPERPEKRFVVREGIMSSAAVPLKAGTEVVGVMFVNYRSPQPFTEGQREVIELFATQAAVAIHNSRLYEQASQRADTLAKLSKIASQRADTLARLSEVGQALVSLEVSPSELERLLQRVAENAQGVLGADVITLYQYVQSRKEFVLPPVIAGELRDPDVPKEQVFDDDVVAKTVRRGSPLYSPKAQDEPQLSDPFELERPGRPEQRFVVREGIESSAAVPLKAGAETVGVMFVNYRSPQSFIEEQQEAIELFANQAAVAIHNARLFELISKQKDELQTISDIGTLLMATLDVREVPKRLMQQVIPLFRVERASLWMVDHATERIQCRLSLNRYGKEDDISEAIRTMSPDVFQLGKGIEGIVAQSGVPKIVNDVKKDPRWDSRVDAETGFTTNSILAVPLTHRGETIGVIELINRMDGTPFTEADQSLMVALASIAAIALANATLYYEVNRDLERRYRELQEEQKKRIAAERLKALGQAAANLSHRMNNLAGIVPVCVQELREQVGDDDEVNENLDIIEQQAKLLLSAADDLSKPFAPSVEAKFDVNTLVRKALKVTQPLLRDRIHVEVCCCEGLPRVKTRKLLEDAFVELITNAAKAMPGRGRLEVETKLVNGNVVEISFTDTGCGIPMEWKEWIFEPFSAFQPEGEPKRPGTGLGLWWVKTFLQQQGGDIELRRSEVGRGSEFVIVHPVS
jgi:GAF domain-containing protein